MEVKKRPNESVGYLLRRFSRLVQQTKLVVRAKKAKYFEKKMTEKKERERAIMREELRALRKRLEKIGKYDEQTFEEEKKKIKQKLGF